MPFVNAFVQHFLPNTHRFAVTKHGLTLFAMPAADNLTDMHHVTL